MAAPVIKSIAQDNDRDGRPEQWNITMQVRTGDWNLESANVILAFDYQTDYSVHM